MISLVCLERDVMCFNLNMTRHVWCLWFQGVWLLPSVLVVRTGIGDLGRRCVCRYTLHAPSGKSTPDFSCTQDSIGARG